MRQGQRLAGLVHQHLFKSSSLVIPDIAGCNSVCTVEAGTSAQSYVTSLSRHLSSLAQPSCSNPRQQLGASPRSLSTASPRPAAFPVPRPLPRFPKVPPPEEITWRRMVLRFPPEVEATVEGGDLALSSRAGSVRINLRQMDPTGLIGYQFYPAPKAADGTQTGSAVMLCCSPSRQYFRGFATHIDNQIRGVLQGYLVGLTLKGVGYRVEPAEAPQSARAPYYDNKFQDKQNVAYPVKRACSAVRLKVGFSDTIVVPLPEDVQAFVVKPTLFYLYGVQLHRVMDAAARIRALRKPNAYTGNGIRLVKEELNLKPKKGGAKAAK